MAHRGPLPPIYNPDRRYDLYKTELELWGGATSVEENKQGVTIALSLPDDDKLHLRSTVLDKVDKDKLKGKDGLKELIALLDELLGEDDLEDSLHKYEEFEDYKKSNGESIAQYIVNFEAKYDKVKNKGIKLPSEVLAFKLLRRSGISRDDKKLVLTGMDYSEKESLYKNAQKALKKYCGEGSSGGGSSASINNRSEYKLDKTEDVVLVVVIMVMEEVSLDVEDSVSGPVEVTTTSEVILTSEASHPLLHLLVATGEAMVI